MLFRLARAACAKSSNPKILAFLAAASICEIFIAMSKKNINSSTHNWINNNKEILRQYRGKWIAHNDTEVLVFAEKGEDLIKIIEEKGIEKYTIAHIHPFFLRRMSEFCRFVFAL